MFFWGKRSSDSSSENGHALVDLGLSVKWATCNLGASSPDQRGNYFSWGETSVKNRYDWDTYRMCRGSQYTLTEYNTDSHSGRVDNQTTLGSSYDVAKIKWGGNWRMPTPKECSELVSRCRWEQYRGASQGNPAVFKIIGPSGNFILLPTTGVQFGDAEEYPMDCGSSGFYWANSIDPGYPQFAYGIGIDFHQNAIVFDRDYRCFGRPVRPVCR